VTDNNSYDFGYSTVLEEKYLGALKFCIVKKLKASDTVCINEGIKYNYIECITIDLHYILKGQ
jgi:hypothetical protein